MMGPPVGGQILAERGRAEPRHDPGVGLVVPEEQPVRRVVHEDEKAELDGSR